MLMDLSDQLSATLYVCMLCCDQMIDTLAVMVLRPQSSLEVWEQDTADARNLVAFMSQHYNHIFKVRRREQRGARQEPLLPHFT